MAAIISRTAEDLRRDLAGGLAAAITEKGYAASTIADIVMHARVSKRTFYEHFSDKEACLMALYEQSCEQLITVVREAASGHPLHAAVHRGVKAYLAALESMPAVTRTLLVEIQAAGPSAFRLRQQTQRRFADNLVNLVEANDTTPNKLTPELALALVGGINELMLQVADPYTADPVVGAQFTSLTGTIERLVHAVLSAEFQPPSQG